MKKILSLILALSLLIMSCFALASCSDEKNPDNTGETSGTTPKDPFNGADPYDGRTPTDTKFFKTKEKDDGTIAITGIYADFEAKELVIPAYINDKLVTEISAAAFTKGQFYSVFIPASITKIGDGAFSSCSLLYDIVMPESVTELGTGVFQSCEYLDTIDFLPKSITKISTRLFAGCTTLRNVTIPEHITEISSFAFADCKSLVSVTIGANVIKMGDNVFGNCPCRKFYITEGSAADEYFTAKVEAGVYRETWIIYNK